VTCSRKTRVAFCIEENPLISGLPVQSRLVDATRTRHHGSIFVRASRALPSPFSCEIIRLQAGASKLAGITDFIALDVETANADFGSICSIGLVHFRSGEVFKSLTILVDPEDEFDPINIAIHGIRPEDVVGKPTMAKVFPVIGAALKDTAIVHHSPFDRTALARAAGRYGAGGLPCTWLDTLQVARRTWDGFREDGGYGLANLARAFGIVFKHHDAAEDARAAGLLMLRAIADGGATLQHWVDEIGYESTVSTAPRRIKPPTASKVARQGDGSGPMVGETIVFTGALQMSRGEAANEAALAGCDVADSVTKKTTILVVGDQDLRYTRGQEKSTKHRKSEAMITKGVPIRIVGESDFLLMVRA
jgi:DNA polymerase-3 subunit epsilon